MALSSNIVNHNLHRWWVLTIKHGIGRPHNHRIHQPPHFHPKFSSTAFIPKKNARASPILRATKNYNITAMSRLPANLQELGRVDVASPTLPYEHFASTTPLPTRSDDNIVAIILPRPINFFAGWANNKKGKWIPLLCVQFIMMYMLIPISFLCLWC